MEQKKKRGRKPKKIIAKKINIPLLNRPLFLEHYYNSVSDIDINADLLKNVYNLITNLSNNVFFYGPGIDYVFNLIKLCIKECYNVDFDSIEKNEYIIKSSTNKYLSIYYKISNHFLYIDFKENLITDLLVIKKIIQEYGNFHSFSETNKRKMIIMSNVNHLNKTIQESLRFVIEHFHESSIFIFTSKQLSCIIKPLQSRFINIRLRIIRDQEIKDIITKKSKQFDIECSEKDIDLMVELSDKNVQRGLILLEYFRLTSKIDETEFLLKWKNDINSFISNIKYNYSDELLLEVRGLLYKCICRVVEPIDILKELVSTSLEYCNNDYKLIQPILDKAGEYDVRIKNGSKYIHHLEAFCMFLVKIFNKN